jgi:putative ATP-dependent endonuclease of the OLD family
MRLRKLGVTGFRGIRSLEWDLAERFICLVGPGDSTKTTILDAIEIVLSPRWNVSFDDTDFYGSDSSNDIAIRALISDLPDTLVSDARFGLDCRGIDESGQVHVEPRQNDDLALEVSLRVGSALEPTWTVASSRHPEGRPISAKDREAFGCLRVGDYLDRHFTWGRGSALSKLTDQGENIGAILADANRAARSQLRNLDETVVPALHKAAKRAANAGVEHGVQSTSELRPLLDARAISIGDGSLALHIGDIPVRRSGLGTRRLLAIGMQREVTNDHSLTLVDEIEHGLEPHRLRHLLRVAQSSIGTNTHQSLILTTHSPVTLAELPASALHIVRSTGGSTTVMQVPARMQAIARRESEAFLANRVLVCEGKTELGLCLGLDESWSTIGASLALFGTSLAFGNGDEAATVALAFAQLGYKTLLLCDSDKAITPDEATVEQAGVTVVRWEDATCVEQRIAADLPLEGMLEMLSCAIRFSDATSVFRAVEAFLGKDFAIEGDPQDWPWQTNNDELRRAVGTAAHSKGWFKQVSRGKQLARIVVSCLPAIPTSDLSKKIHRLQAWAHGR